MTTWPSPGLSNIALSMEDASGTQRRSQNYAPPNPQRRRLGGGEHEEDEKKIKSSGLHEGLGRTRMYLSSKRKYLLNHIPVTKMLPQLRKNAVGMGNIDKAQGTGAFRL